VSLIWGQDAIYSHEVTWACWFLAYVWVVSGQQVPVQGWPCHKVVLEMNLSDYGRCIRVNDYPVMHIHATNSFFWFVFFQIEIRHSEAGEKPGDRRSNPTQCTRLWWQTCEPQGMRTKCNLVPLLGGWNCRKSICAAMPARSYPQVGRFAMGEKLVRVL